MTYYETTPLTFHSRLQSAVKLALFGKVSINEVYIPDFAIFKAFFLAKYSEGESIICQFVAPLSLDYPAIVDVQRCKITRTSTGYQASIVEDSDTFKYIYSYKNEVREDYEADSYERLHYPQTHNERIRLTIPNDLKTPYTLYPVLTPDGLTPKQSREFIPSKFNPFGGVVSTECQEMFGDATPYTMFIGFADYGFIYRDGIVKDSFGNWEREPALERIPFVYHGISSLLGSGYDFALTVAALFGSEAVKTESSIVSLKWKHTEYHPDEPLTNYHWFMQPPFDDFNYNLQHGFQPGFSSCYGASSVFSTYRQLKVGILAEGCRMYDSEENTVTPLPERNYLNENANFIEYHRDFWFIDIRNFTLSKLLPTWKRPTKRPLTSSPVFPFLPFISTEGENAVLSALTNNSLSIRFNGKLNL